MGEDYGREISFALHAAKRKKEIALRQAEEAEAILEKVEGLDLDIDFDFPLIKTELLEMQHNLDLLALDVEGLKKADEEIEEIKKTADYISSYAHYLANVIDQARVARKKGTYLEALALFENVKIPAYLRQFKFFALYYEIFSYIKASLFHDLAEDNISKGVAPLLLEQFDAYAALVETLPIGLHDEKEKNFYLDHVRSIYFCLCLDEIKRSPYLEASRVDAYLNSKHGFATPLPYVSNLTKWRYRLFKAALLEAYNRSCFYFFDKKRDYKNALALFHQSLLFSKTGLQHEAYINCNDDESFRVAFLKQDTLSKEGEDFAYEVSFIAEAIANPFDISSRTLADIYFHPSLEKKEKDALIRCLQKCNFMQRVFFVDACFENPMDKEDCKALVNLIAYNKKSRIADLERVSSSLLRIKKKVKYPESVIIEEVIRSLFRSARAIKLAVKSTNENVRALARLTYDGPPKGKPTENKLVRARSLGAYVFLWILAFLIPILLYAGASTLIVLYCPQDKWNYAFLAPLFFLYFYILRGIILHYGNDERGSAYARRVFGLVCFIFSLATLLYFIFPSYFSFMSGYGYTAIIFSSVMVLYTQIALKEYRVKAGFWMFWPSAVILVGALFFMIFDMMNGLI